MFGFAVRGRFLQAVFVCAVYSVCLPVACGRIGFDSIPVGGGGGRSGGVVSGGVGAVDGGTATDDGTIAADGGTTATDSSTAIDSGTVADGGTATDSGTVADGGTATDSGTDSIDGSVDSGGAITDSDTFADAGCPNLCENPHGTAECIDGACIPSCSGGFADCDGDTANGCEVDLLTDVNHCSACSNGCGPYDDATALCVSGGCGLLCSDGYGNCTLDLSDGCETALNTLSNCGGCGVTCNLTRASVSCSTGSCKLEACDYGYANCDGNETTGCETQLMDVANGLRGFWSLDETSGLVTADSSSYGRNGVLTNMTGNEWITGQVNGALQFDGVNDYVSIGDVGTGIKTYSFWIRNDYVASPVTDTGDKAPTANGSPNGDWSNGERAYTNDGLEAQACFLLIAGNKAHDWSGFTFGVPSDATIKGVEVNIESQVSTVTLLGSYAVSLSWNAGSSYTSSKSIPSSMLGTSEKVFTLGGATDTWGHSWTPSEINNSFRIKAYFTALGIGGCANIDYITVKVTYLPYAGQKMIDINGSAQIELVGNALAATNFSGTTAYYVDGASGTALSSGWHHVAITTTTGVNASSFKLGHVSTGYFVGALDEVRVYDRVLTASDIAFLSGTGNTSCP